MGKLSGVPPLPRPLAQPPASFVADPTVDPPPVSSDGIRLRRCSQQEMKRCNRTNTLVI